MSVLCIRILRKSLGYELVKLLMKILRKTPVATANAGMKLFIFL